MPVPMPRFCFVSTALVIALSGCLGPAVRLPAHERAAPLREYRPPPRGTPLSEVRRELRRRGATNVASARGVDGEQELVALTADGLAHVLLFRDGRLSRALPIGCDRGTNVQSFVHLARAEGAAAVVLLSPGLLSRGVPSAFVLLDRRPNRRYVIAHDLFPEWFKGLVDPRIVGAELGWPGVTLVARGDDGRPWDHALIFRCDGKQVEVTPVSMVEAARCGCIRDWYAGVR